ncbi:MAG: hypothetical protein U1E43_08095, partial [Rhodospirillales bacterium]
SVRPVGDAELGVGEPVRLAAALPAVVLRRGGTASASTPPVRDAAGTGPRGAICAAIAPSRRRAGGRRSPARHCPLLEDASGAFAQACGDHGGCLLVRPDGHIGWRGPSWRSDSLLAYLRQFALPVGDAAAGPST